MTIHSQPGKAPDCEGTLGLLSRLYIDAPWRSGQSHLALDQIILGSNPSGASTVRNTMELAIAFLLVLGYFLLDPKGKDDH